MSDTKKTVSEYFIKGEKKMNTVRKLDELGRIVFPKEMRAMLDICPKDELQVICENEEIMIRKSHSGCKLCGSSAEIMEPNLQICQSCVEKIKKL